MPHMAVERLRPALISVEIDGHRLRRTDHRNVLDDAGNWHSGDVGQLEVVLMQVDRIHVVG